MLVGTQLAQENVPPSAALGRGDGELEGGPAGGVAEDRGAGKQAPAQGGQFRALRLTEPALETDAQVVGADGEVTGRFGGPERAAAQALQAKLGAEFLDPVFDVGPAVVTTPHFEGTDAGRQVGPQRLELVAGHLEQLLPASVWSFEDALTQNHQPGAVVGNVLHLDVRQLESLTKACGIDFANRDHVRNANRYLKRGRFDYLKRDPSWPYFQELLATYAEHLRKP